MIARSQAPISQRSLSSTPGRAYIKYGKASGQHSERKTGVLYSYRFSQFAAIENVWKKQINLGDILNELRELQAIVRFDGKNSNLAGAQLSSLNSQ